MRQTLEQHSLLAASLDKAAGDQTVPLDQRVEFARWANWFRILGRLAAKAPAGHPGRVLETNAPAARLPPSSHLSSFKRDLLLRHYGCHAREERPNLPLAGALVNG